MTLSYCPVHTESFAIHYGVNSGQLCVVTSDDLPGVR